VQIEFGERSSWKELLQKWQQRRNDNTIRYFTEVTCGDGKYSLHGVLLFLWGDIP
jgi:hypothetical protein